MTTRQAKAKSQVTLAYFLYSVVWSVQRRGQQQQQQLTKVLTVLGSQIPGSISRPYEKEGVKRKYRQQFEGEKTSYLSCASKFESPRNVIDAVHCWQQWDWHVPMRRDRSVIIIMSLEYESRVLYASTKYDTTCRRRESQE